MNTKLLSIKQNGFTLIELLITTSLTVLLMLTITTLFMTFLLGNSKTNIRKTLKEEGLHAINQMEFIIKNASYYDATYAACAENLTSISIVGLDDGTTVYQLSGTQIASSSSLLTSTTVDASDLNFDCSGTAGNIQIKISFTLEKAAPTLGENELISESFTTTVNMRN